MTVSQLIDRLRDLPPDLQVFYTGCGESPVPILTAEVNYKTPPWNVYNQEQDCYVPGPAKFVELRD